MARPKRQTVDFFLHYCKGGKTLYILEGKYGNDGYAFWFKLLELLGESEGHFYSCVNTTDWEFLLAKTRVREDVANGIIDTLIDLGKIDADLWRAGRILWVENLVKYLAEVYKRRRADLPRKPSLVARVIPAETNSDNHSPELMYAETMVNAYNNPAELDYRQQKLDRVDKSRVRVEESKEEESKEEKSKEEKSRLLPAHTWKAVVDAWNTILGDHLPKVQTLTEGRKEALKARLEELSSDMDEAVGMLTEAFEKVKQSTFLLGDNDRGWSATFDWVIQSADKLAKIIEGVYDDHGTNRKATNSDIALGVDEWIESGTGRRTYGTGATTIPTDAPPRPSARHQWDAASGLWILI